MTQSTPRSTRTGGRFMLDVAGHNVGFLSPTPPPPPPPPPAPAPISWHAGSPPEPFAGMAEFAAGVRRRHPAGVHGILIGVHPVPRQQGVVGSDGSQGVLIGLLLPAVQRLLEPASSDRLLLASALRLGGWIGMRLADGSVRALGDPSVSLPACLLLERG